MNIFIAIADDHPMVIKGVQTMLDECNFIQMIASYNNGEELLAGLQKKQPDVILLDIHMPGKRGDELAAIISKTYPTIKILALTNLDQTAQIQTMLHNGALGYLMKSADYNTMIDAIKTVYMGQQYIDATLKEQMHEDMLSSRKEKTLIPELSHREKEILKLMAASLTSQEIAEKVFLSKRTIDFHRTNLLVKFDVKNAASLIKKAIDYGILR